MFFNQQLSKIFFPKTDSRDEKDKRCKAVLNSYARRTEARMSARINRIFGFL